MLKEKIYPNYRDRYYYENGDDSILIKRWNGEKINYRNYINFDTSEEASKYFDNL